MNNPPNNIFASKLDLLFLTSTDLGENDVALKTLATILLLCFFLITSMDMNDLPSFQCSKASSSPMNIMEVYRNFCFNLAITKIEDFSVCSF